MKALTGMKFINGRTFRVNIKENDDVGTFSDVEYADPAIYKDSMSVMDYRNAQREYAESRNKWIGAPGYEHLCAILNKEVAHDPVVVDVVSEKWDAEIDSFPLERGMVDVSMHSKNYKMIELENLVDMAANLENDWIWNSFLRMYDATWMDIIYSVSHHVRKEYRCGYFKSVSCRQHIELLEGVISDIVYQNKGHEITPFNILDYLKEIGCTIAVEDFHYDIKYREVGFRIARGFYNVPVLAPCHMVMFNRLGYRGMVPYYYDEKCIVRMFFREAPLNKGGDKMSLSEYYVYLVTGEGSVECAEVLNEYDLVPEFVLVHRDFDIMNLSYDEYFNTLFLKTGACQKIIETDDGESFFRVYPYYGNFNHELVAIDGSERHEEFRIISFDDFFPMSYRCDMVSSNDACLIAQPNNLYRFYGNAINSPENMVENAVIREIANATHDNMDNYSKNHLGVVMFVKLPFKVVKQVDVLTVVSGHFSDRKYSFPYDGRTDQKDYVTAFFGALKNDGVIAVSDYQGRHHIMTTWFCDGNDCLDSCDAYTCHYEYTIQKAMLFRNCRRGEVVTWDFLHWYFSSIHKVMAKAYKLGMIEAANYDRVIANVDAGHDDGSPWELTEVQAAARDITSLRRGTRSSMIRGVNQDQYSVLMSLGDEYSRLVDRSTMIIGDDYANRMELRDLLILQKKLDIHFMNLRRKMSANEGLLRAMHDDIDRVNAREATIMGEGQLRPAMIDHREYATLDFSQ